MKNLYIIVFLTQIIISISIVTMEITPKESVKSFLNKQLIDAVQYKNNEKIKNQQWIKLLIDIGAEVNVRDDMGCTPLHYIIMKANSKLEETNKLLKIFYLVIKNGARVDIKNNKGNTPLHLATLIYCIQFARFLVENGADVNAKNKKGNTPLHFAAQNKYYVCNHDCNFDVLNKRITRFLIKKGANVNVKNNQGNTPIYYAIKYGYLRTVKLLIKNGANLNVVNNKNENLLDCCWYNTVNNINLTYYNSDVSRVLVKAINSPIAKPIVFHNLINNDENDITKEQRSFLDLAHKINYSGLIGRLINERLPGMAIEGVVDFIFPINDSIERKYLEMFARQCYRNANTLLSKIFFIKFYNQHLFQLQDTIFINDDFVQLLPYFNKKQIACWQQIKNAKKYYDDLDSSLKKKIEKSYKKYLSHSFFHSLIKKIKD